MPRSCTIAHHTPGRIRFNAPDSKGDVEFFERISRAASAVQGVQAIQVRPVMGSVVIHYGSGDPDCPGNLEKAVCSEPLPTSSLAPSRKAPTNKVKAEAKNTVTEEASLVACALPESSETQVATELVATDAKKLATHSGLMATLVCAFQALDRKVKHATKNFLNLQLLVLLPFGIHSLLFRKKDIFFWVLLGLFSIHAYINLTHPLAKP